MRIERIRLHNFRNYAEMRLSPDDGLCVLTGENAAGKTNVLEAIFLSALGRSHRTSHDAEMIRSGQDAGLVSLSLQTLGGMREIECRLLAGERKRLSIDKQPLTRSGELLGCLNVVLFAPEDMSLVKGGPGERRRFLDMEISQLKPAYYYTLQRYNSALKQRNALLKEPLAPAFDTVGQWDEQLAVLGASITLARSQFLERLAEIAHGLHLTLSGGRETLLVGYQPSVEPDDPTVLIDKLRDALAAGLDRDVYRGFTSVGPHRDDVSLLLDGTDVRVFGSQGQQRTTVLSLKLSELQILREERGEPPVLLLDDVFSELDRRRQTMLLRAVAGCQTFVTCTHIDALTDAGADRMQVYQVADGAILEL